MQIDVLKYGVRSNRFREISLEKYTLDTEKGNKFSKNYGNCHG
jgi:hypothetical protein